MAGAPDAADAWGEHSRRVGVVALKCGMIPDWDEWGERHPLTVLKLEDVQVCQVKTADVHGFNAIQVGGGEAKPKRVNKPMGGHFAASGITPKIVLAEFPVTEDALVPVGTTITAQHFAPGQYVDVRGVTKGKGFAGVMKRYGFRGQPASHGVSKTHRSLGSTGASQGPGRVWKGKKMPGRMGGKNRTAQSLLVYKVDIKRNLVFVRGSVPGHNGNYVRITDSRRRPHKPEAMPPFPTFFPNEDDEERMRKWADGVFVPVTQLGKDRGLEEGREREPPFEVICRPSPINPFGIHDWEEGE